MKPFEYEIAIETDAENLAIKSCVRQYRLFQREGPSKWFAPGFQARQKDDDLQAWRDRIAEVRRREALPR